MSGSDAVEFIQKFWLQFLLTGISGGLAFLCKRFYSKIKQEREAHKKEQEAYLARQKVQETAICAILHDRLLQSLTYHLEKKEINSDQMDNLKIMYDSYIALGGNGTIKILWERFQKYIKIARPEVSQYLTM